VFGVNVGYHDAADHHNRDVFEEQVAIFKAGRVPVACGSLPRPENSVKCPHVIPW
jgi:hypothetical protein